MINKNEIKNLANRLLLVFLILSQLSNALLVSDLLDIRDKIALNSDIDNSAKEDKSTLDNAEESKILEKYFHSIYFSAKSTAFDYLIESFKEVVNTDDLPPPELNS